MENAEQAQATSAILEFLQAQQNPAALNTNDIMHYLTSVIPGAYLPDPAWLQSRITQCVTHIKTKINEAPGHWSQPISGIDPQAQYIADKCADLVVRSGVQFEEQIKASERGNPLYRFLFEPDSPLHHYYQQKLFEIANPRFMPAYKGSIPNGFIYGFTPERVRQRYRAAGLLPWARHGSEVYVLLGCEARDAPMSQDSSPRLSWLHFGGKRNEGEIDPETTAVREFDEETGGLFKEAILHLHARLLQPECTKVWYEEGKYVLFFSEISWDATVPARFDSLKKCSTASTQHVALRWVPVEEVAALRDSATIDGVPQAFYPFFAEMLRGVFGIPGYLLSLQHAPAPSNFPLDYRYYRISGASNAMQLHHTGGLQAPTAPADVAPVSTPAQRANGPPPKRPSPAGTQGQQLADFLLRTYQPVQSVSGAKRRL